MMKLAEFENLLLTHGDDLANWPDEARLRAERLLSDNNQARDLRTRFAKFENTLHRSVSVTPQGAALTGRILANVAARKQLESVWSIKFDAGFWSVVSGVSAVSIVALGFFVGTLDIVWLDGVVSADVSYSLLFEAQGLVGSL